MNIISFSNGKDLTANAVDNARKRDSHYIRNIGSISLLQYLQEFIKQSIINRQTPAELIHFYAEAAREERLMIGLTNLLKGGR